MTIILVLEKPDTLDNGQPDRITLDRHGAMIGRSPHADWSLPDPRNLVSARHCDISYRDGAYVLTDHSTNGTYLNGDQQRLEQPHRLADGDRITIGHYAILVSAEPVVAMAPSPQAHPERWDSFGLDQHPDETPLDDEGWAEPLEAGFDQPTPWRAPTASPAPLPGAWDLPAPVARPSAWSSEPPRAAPPTAQDVWGRLSEESDIDWSRGNFAEIGGPDDDWSNHQPVVPSIEEASQPAPEIEGVMDAPMPPAEGWDAFLAASHLPAERLRRSPAATLAAAGGVLRQLVGGLVLMIEARARAKAQLGVQATGLELDGNNPLKFIRSPQRALLHLLDTPEAGFMTAERAIEDTFQDLQAHQMATLSAMRAALEGTLARFSPAAIRDRPGAPRGMARWFGTIRRAQHWDAFERDFEGVVRGADDAFMDLFAKEFRQHYDRHMADMKAKRGTGG
ncbi:type VI secretion system-associated FHA domain protein TagH [Novosphingobium sp.]|uniref:type VI secretion system-associated FHA domain protein TagH n=1 Tax=Novosphingobium sp. TaxID=1874826 RepID=UPI0031DFFFD4